MHGRYRAIPGQYRAIPGRFRAITGQYRAIPGQYRAIPGRFRAIPGPGTGQAIPGPGTGQAIPIPAEMAGTETVSPIPVSVLLTPVAEDAIMKSSTYTPDVANQSLSFIVSVLKVGVAVC